MIRKRLSTRDRLRIFEAQSGVCHLCEIKIQVGERWEVSHIIPLELGGEDTDGNRAPAHYKCHREHTAKNDAPAIAKSRRVRANHSGAKRSRNPMPGGRDSPWRKKISGEVVRR